MSKIKRLKECRGFKVGELVEQVGFINKKDSRLCKIISFDKRLGGRVMVKHKHLNKRTYNTIWMISFGPYTCNFKKIPKLRRILKYGV